MIRIESRPILLVALTAVLLTTIALGKSALANPACGEAMYCCDQWYSAPPDQPRCLFDINFGFGGEGPTQAQRDAVLNAGGRIVHEFNLERIRAQVCVADVPSLQALLVRAVRGGATDYTVDAVFGIPVPLSPEHEAFLDSLGVQVLGVLDHVDLVHALVPDASIPTIRAHPEVRHLGENGIFCCPLLKQAERGSHVGR